MSVSQENEGEPIAMVSGVFKLNLTFRESQYPCITSCYWIAVYVAQEIHAVFHRFEIFLLTKVPIGLGVIEDKPSALSFR